MSQKLFLSLFICSVVPTFEEKPDFDLRMENSTSSVSFECSFDALEPEKTEEFEYTVQWYVNDNKIFEDRIGNSTSAFWSENSIPVLSYGDKVSMQKLPNFVCIL